MIIFEKFSFKNNATVKIYPEELGGFKLLVESMHDDTFISIHVDKNETKELLDLLMSNYESSVDQS